MATLSTTDMKLIDSIFGMYSGYVLDFSNDRFAAFFRRDLGVDIYSDRYAIHGNSKGKLLRGYVETAPNSDVARALSALWEYREASRLDRNDAETVANARVRLNTLVTKLGGSPLPARLDETPTTPIQTPQTPATPSGPSDGVLTALEAEFLAMTNMNETPQQRGYAFERFLKRWCDTWGLDAHASFRTIGEQIDGSFQHEGARTSSKQNGTTNRSTRPCYTAFKANFLSAPTGPVACTSVTAALQKIASTHSLPGDLY